MFRVPVCLLALLPCLLASGPAPAGPPDDALSAPLHAYLDAGFDHLPLGQPIGNGGAENGEPVSISSGVLTEVVPRGDGRALRVTRNTELVTSVGLTWEMLDSTEIDTGILVVHVVMTPEARDNFSWGLREQGGATRSFFNFRLWGSGDITVFHAGSAGLSIGTYEGGQTLNAMVLMDMDAGTYSVVLDDVLVVSDRAHGISDRGVGRMITNLLSSASNGRWFDLSHILVLGALPAAVFADGFE
jgi:hypothetical protein